MILPTFCIAAIALIALAAVIRGFILEGQRDKARAAASENERRAEAFERHAIRCNTERDEARIALRIAVERENWKATVAKLPMSFGRNVLGGEA
jgi:hypothetical protein